MRRQVVMAVERVMVPFEGAGTGVEPLSWGQRELWNGMCQQRTWMPIGLAYPLRPGTTVERVVAELRFLIGRHQALRTRLRLAPDGPPSQVVAGSGEIPLEIVDAPEDADPAEVAERVRLRYWNGDYDFVHEWPLKAAVIRQRGVPTHQVFVMCHLVTDGHGAMVMSAEQAQWRDAVTLDPVTAAPPLEQARWQASPAGRRQSAAVLRRTERILREISPRRFPGSNDWREPRYWHATLESPAAHLAVRMIVERLGTGSATVLLALFAVALGRVTGVSPVVTRATVNNRFRKDLTASVSPVSQNALCVIDVADTTVDEVIARTLRTSVSAYKNAYYDPFQMDAMVERVNRERGEKVDIGCFFNDRRLTVRDDTGHPAPTLQEVRDALGRTEFRWQAPSDKPSEHLFVHLDDVPDTVAISAFADTHHLSPADLEACVRGIEEVAVAAAGDPAARTGVGAVVPA